MRKHTILCVDDEENILASLERVFLEEDDYEIITANGGERALEVLKQRDVHLIISDQRMPGMSGTEFLKKARLLRPDTIRIVLSGYADFDTVTAAINEGEIYRLVQKPWQTDELLRVVRDALERYDLLQENRKLQQKVQKQNELLKALNRELEERVAQRTRELEISNQVLFISQEILHQLSIPVMGISSEGMVVLINQAAQNIYGGGGMSLIGRYIADIFPEALITVIESTVKTKRMQKAEGIVYNHHYLAVRCLPLSSQCADRGVILETDVIRQDAGANAACGCIS